MYRLFVALDLPAAVREALAGIRMDLREARWVKSDQLHLTLRFIGPADESLKCRVQQSLSSIIAPAFSLSLTRVGHFPPGQMARIIWVGVERQLELLQLQRQIERVLQLTGIAPEGRPFSPHITLARIREPQPGLTMKLEKEQQGFVTPSFPVSEFHLYSSLLTDSGAIHNREATYQLALS